MTGTDVHCANALAEIWLAVAVVLEISVCDLAAHMEKR